MDHIGVEQVEKTFFSTHEQAAVNNTTRTIFKHFLFVILYASTETSSGVVKPTRSQACLALSERDMLEDFPKVDLSSRKDLDAALDVIRQHSYRLLTAQLSQAGLGRDRDAERTCREAIDLVRYVSNCMLSTQMLMTMNTSVGSFGKG